MYNSQIRFIFKGFKGVCESILTLRDIFFNHSIYQTASEVIIQEHGDVVIVHPSAIYNVNNLGVNLAKI